MTLEIVFGTRIPASVPGRVGPGGTTRHSFSILGRNGAEPHVADAAGECP